MNKVLLTKRFIYFWLASILLVLIKAFVRPFISSDQFAGLYEIALVIFVGLPILGVALLIYIYFKTTESQYPVIKNRKLFWQIIGIAMIVAICFWGYASFLT